MVQVHTCVSVHCDQCGDSLGSPGCEAHYATEIAALDAATGQGWLIGPGSRWYCSACGPVLTCEAEGHVFTPWRLVLPRDEESRELAELAAMPEGSTELARARSVSREYRYCQRCCLHESHQDHSRENAGPGRGTGTSRPTGVGLAGSVVGEVA